MDFFERLSAMGVKAVTASQLAAAPLPTSSVSVANSNKEVEGTSLPLDTNIVPSIEEIHRLANLPFFHFKIEFILFREYSIQPVKL